MFAYLFVVVSSQQVTRSSCADDEAFCPEVLCCGKVEVEARCEKIGLTRIASCMHHMRHCDCCSLPNHTQVPVNWTGEAAPMCGTCTCTHRDNARISQHLRRLGRFNNGHPLVCEFCNCTLSNLTVVDIGWEGSDGGCNSCTCSTEGLVCESCQDERDSQCETCKPVPRCRTLEFGFVTDTFCEFPFKINNQTYWSCTMDDARGGEVDDPWCSTNVVDGNHVVGERNWGNCEDTAACKPGAREVDLCTIGEGESEKKRPCFMMGYASSGCILPTDGIARHGETFPCNGGRGRSCPMCRCNNFKSVVDNEQSCFTACKVLEEWSKNVKSCVFPFTFGNKTHSACTTDGNDDVDDPPWCSTQVDMLGNHIGRRGSWGNCTFGSDCPVERQIIID